ncbi:histidine kinase [Paenibacillus alginolyticus]|uniref:histidine kinase n=1 Tax=Paenibacillus alginolyticus TaxID=59839 RepID=A0ABT4GJ86_9BACL|nr:histidine kinase [Paenibacillus alginolyticus]MCY9696099.1 histidine kinase [Paenibacillus alginolyticus]MEC0143380.1 histidine kinase [Paenibacillus alginolyticus]
MKTFFLRTLKGRMILYYCTIFIIFIALLGGVTYQIFMNVMTNQILQYTEKIIEEKRSSIDSYFNQVVNLVQISAGSQVLRDAIKQQDNQDSISKLYYQRQVSDYFTNILRFNSNINDFFIINEKGYIYAQSGATVNNAFNFFNQPWFQEIHSDYFHVYFLGVHPEDYYILDNNNEGNVVSAIAPIYDLNSVSSDRKVYLLCNMKVKGIESISNETQLEKTGYITILDQNNNPIYKPTGVQFSLNSELERTNYFKQESGYFTLGNGLKKNLIVYKTLKTTNWKVVAYIPYSEMYAHTDAIRYMVPLSILIVIILVVLASVLIAARINKPLMRLTNKMYLIEGGHTDVELFDNSTEEIEKLTRRIDSMINKIKTLTEENFSYILQNKESELKILLSQINPHFLNNTLQSIKAMAVIGKTSEISRMVTLIGNMLRYAINSSQDVVTIQDEIDHITNYLKIQNYRYPEKFMYDTVISDEIRRFYMPKLILQPVVENAILHAFQQLQEGRIQLTFEAVSQGIQITIFDNGRGMSSEELEEVSEKLSKFDPDEEYKGGVGLRNVHQRIRNKYGYPYGIILSSEINAGTSVTILIPWLGDA